MTDLAITSAIESNYQGMIAMVGADHRVYLGKPENCYLSPEGDAPGLLRQFGSLLAADFRQHQDVPFSVQPGPCQCLSGRCAGEKCFTKADYIEFASLREGVLSRYPLIREVTFAGKPFVPPKAHRRMHRSRRAAPAR